ncbi:IS5/IS1182 family transposase, partial [Salmonella enterica]
DDQRDQRPNRGKLLLDATCAPADIAYPTDLRLLNEAREKLEGIIDTLHEPYRGQQRKPRTYRKKARKAYLSVAKQRNPR